MCCPIWSRPPYAAAKPGWPNAALGWLAERALAADTPLALGLLARSRALLAADGNAEPLYAEAIKHLRRCRTAPELARAHLVYGNGGAASTAAATRGKQLRAAHDIFASMGAEAFAERNAVRVSVSKLRGGGPISSRLLPFTTALDTDVTRLGSRPGYPLMAGPPAVARWWRAHLEPVRRRWPRSSL